ARVDLVGSTYMSSLPKAVPAENISNLLNTTEQYECPAIVANSVQLKDWKGEIQRARENPDKFWGDFAKTFIWTKPWSKVLEFDGVNHKWFVGGRTKITIN